MIIWLFTSRVIILCSVPSSIYYLITLKFWDASSTVNSSLVAGLNRYNNLVILLTSTDFPMI